MPVVFVTGRPARWMADVADRTGHTGLAICANGAVLYDLHTEQVVRAPHDPGRGRAGGRAPAAGRGAGQSRSRSRRSTGSRYEPSYVPHWDAGQPAGDRAAGGDLRRAGASSCWRGTRCWTRTRCWRRRVEVVGDLVELTHSSTTALLEISAAGVSKASGLARFAARHGVDAADVVAFGDMPNDLAMLAWAGPAYAVARRPPGRARRGDRHGSLPPEQDGVARELELLFDL